LAVGLRGRGLRLLLGVLRLLGLLRVFRVLLARRLCRRVVLAALGPFGGRLEDLFGLLDFGGGRLAPGLRGRGLRRRLPRLWLTRLGGRALGATRAAHPAAGAFAVPPPPLTHPLFLLSHTHPFP